MRKIWKVGETKRKFRKINGKRRLCEIKKLYKGVYSIHLISGRRKIKIPGTFDRKMVEEATEFQESRDPRSVENDNNRYNKNTLSLTKPNLEKWMANPNKYDLAGIDTLKKLTFSFNKVYKNIIHKETYSKSDVLKAREYLRRNKQLYKNSTYYIELQSEIAKSISQGVDPATIDWIAYMSGDKRLAETLRDERDWRW